MDPRHKLTKSLDQLFVDSENTAIMSARTDDEAARNAANSGVTPEAIKQKLVENLGATHVEIEDMSGMLPTCKTCTLPSIRGVVRVWVPYKYIVNVTRPPADIPHRRMWANVRSHYCLTTVHQEDNVSKTPSS